MSIKRILLLAALCVLVLGIAAPFIAADRYGDQIRVGIEQALQRKVEIHGPVRFNLLTGPGFTVGGVLIREDPALGIEPLAYVEELSARVSLLSLFTGRLEFASLHLDLPFLNVTRNEHGWNLLPLLAQRRVPGGAPGLPDLRVSGGRVNFKIGDTKSPFYVNKAEISVSPRRGGGLDISFEGEPARTDRTSQSFGTLRAKGRYSGGEMDLRVELEKSPIDEIAQLLQGHRAGVHGLVASRARVTGPISNLQIAGTLQIEDVHRWDMIGGKPGGVTFEYRGSLNAAAERLEISAPPAQNPGIGVFWNVRLQRFLSNPTWGVDVSIDQLPAASVLAFARHMGAQFPTELTIGGNVVGIAGYDSAGGMQGRISVQKGVIQFPGAAQLQVANAEFVLQGEAITLLPAQLTGDQGQSATLDGFYQPSRNLLSTRISGRSLPVAQLTGGAGNLLAGAPAPFLSNLRGGTWTGALMYHFDRDTAGEWVADFEVRDTSVRLPGIAAPVRLARASVFVEGDRVNLNRIRAHAGNIPFEGDYEYQPGAPNPHKFRLTAGVVPLAEIEKLFLPTLQRTEGFLARTLRFRKSAAPDWMKTRHAEGTLKFTVLEAGGLALENFRSRILWNGSQVTADRLQASLNGGRLEALATADLSGDTPRYRVNGHVGNAAWRDGRLDIKGKLETQGVGIDLLLGLQADGEFQARTVAFASDYPFRTASGAFDFEMSRSGPQIRLSSLEAAVGNERYSGQGGTQRDGRLDIELVNGARTMRLSGVAAPLRLDVTTQPIAR